MAFHPQSGDVLLTASGQLELSFLPLSFPPSSRAHWFMLGGLKYLRFFAFQPQRITLFDFTPSPTFNDLFLLSLAFRPRLRQSSSRIRQLSS